MKKTAAGTVTGRFPKPPTQANPPKPDLQDDDFMKSDEWDAKIEDELDELAMDILWLSLPSD